jgi:predicted phosphodiesterase
MTMKLGLISDTHGDRIGAIPHIINEFKKRDVTEIIHCGDIEPKHLNPDLFGNLPVVCALVDDQFGQKEFSEIPDKWRFAKPKDRVVFMPAGGMNIYVGHRRSFDFLAGSEAKLRQILFGIRKENDNTRYVVSGHTHHQIYCQCGSTISFINPGAVEASLDHCPNFVTVDTDTEEVVFSRILTTKPTIKPFSVAIISGSSRISIIDPDFWKKLAEELKKRDVFNIIHCGNIALQDINHPELKDFHIYFNLTPDQDVPKEMDENWELIDPKNPVIETFDGEYRFYVQFDLGATLLKQSEGDMYDLSVNLGKKYPGIDYVLCGLTHDALFEQGQEMSIINPGDVIRSRSYVVVSLPQNEISFARIPIDPLPPIMQ